jgi:transposase-like protein
LNWMNGSRQYSPQSFHLISREQLRKMAVDEGKTDAEIAAEFGVTANEVNRKRRQMNLVAGQMSSYDLAEAVRLAEAVKRLPVEAISEIKAVVEKYTTI